MFIRTKKTPRNSSTSVQIVESIRDAISGKNKQKVIKHIGTAYDDQHLFDLKRLAELIKNEIKSSNSANNLPMTCVPAQFIGTVSEITQEEVINAKYLEREQQHILGIHDVYGCVYDYLGFTNLLARPKQREHAAKILKDIVLARIAYPTSKRESVSILANKFGIEINLDHVYQMMDKLDDTFCEKIQQRALSAALKIMQGKINVLFYDVTTLYFESFKEDDLKENGYSKDLKFNQPQILLALFVTDKGLPLGYEVFPRKTFEGHTLKVVIEKLQIKYNIDQIVFVADRGMFSKENLAYLEEKGFKYVVGAKLRSMTEKRKEEILNKENYKPLADVEDLKVFEFLIKDTKRVVVSFSNKRALKNQLDRKRTVEQLRTKLAKEKSSKGLISNSGYKKYIKVSEGTEVTVDEEKIAKDAQWDGLHGVITNVNYNRLKPEA